MMLPHRLAFLNFSNRTIGRGRPQRVFSVTVPDPLPVREPEGRETEVIGVDGGAPMAADRRGFDTATVPAN